MQPFVARNNVHNYLPSNSVIAGVSLINTLIEPGESIYRGRCTNACAVVNQL